jgi:hypothetical protein
MAAFRAAGDAERFTSDLGYQMNDSERTVLEYLVSRGLGPVVHEPDGNVPPDFLVDGKVAVEVRRLNQNEETATGYRGLEEVSHPLDTLMQRALSSRGPPICGASWFVCYTYRRPLPPWKELEGMVRCALEQIRGEPNLEELELRVTSRFSLDFTRASKVHSDLFVLGGSSDHDTGGFVVAEMARNLRLCIAEKSRKVSKVRWRYPEWWLAFEDRIGYGVLDERDRNRLSQLILHDALWSKIILVSPIEPSVGFEL